MSGERAAHTCAFVGAPNVVVAGFGALEWRNVVGFSGKVLGSVSVQDLPSDCSRLTRGRRRARHTSPASVLLTATLFLSVFLRGRPCHV